MQEEYQNIEEENHNNPAHPAPLGRNQKIAAAVLILFAVAVLGMWSRQFKKSITQPFAYTPDETNSPTGDLVSGQENSEEGLKSKDTDGDGLSDWDELNLYNTSPYLEDSDSDGFTDKQEIDSGNDPNCPTGRDCYGVEVVDNSNTKSNNLVNQLNIQEQQQELQDVLSGQGDADTLRQMLLDAGMDKNILDQISNEDLLKSYQETLNK
jgi:hypothetical protein